MSRLEHDNSIHFYIDKFTIDFDMMIFMSECFLNGLCPGVIIFCRISSV